MSNNIYKQMLVQQDPQMFGPLVNQSQGQPISPANMVIAEALGRGAAATPAAAIPQQISGADTLAKFKLQNQQRDAAARQRAINPGNTAGFGRYAPLAGALKGIAAQYVRGKDDIKLEEAMQGYEQEQQRLYEQKVAQARLAREQKLQDTEIKQANAIELEQAKQAAIAANRAPIKPTGRDLIAHAKTLPPEQQAQFLATFPEGVAYMAEMRGQKTREAINQPEGTEGRAAILRGSPQGRDTLDAEADASATAEINRLAAAEKDKALEIVTSLLSPERNGSMKAAVGPVDSMFPTLLGKTADYELDFNALGDLLTMDNLGRMSGVLSESDIALLRAAATGGLSLEGSHEGVTGKLQNIYRGLSGEDWSLDVYATPPPGDTGPGVDTQASPGPVVNITTQEEYDSLDSGDIFSWNGSTPTEKQ